MPASTERLLERIALVKKAIITGQTRGDDVSHLQEELLLLSRSLNVASEALAEGRQILND